MFAADVECLVHGTDLGTIILTGPADMSKAGEIMNRFDAMIGVRHSGLLEVTGDPEFVRLMAMGIVF